MGDDRQKLLAQLKKLLGPEGLLDDAAARRVYAQDSSHLQWGRPWAIALPRLASEVAHIVELCTRAGVPIVCRGSGTGLSGGAVPVEGALVLGTARCQQSDPVCPSDQSVQVQVGVLNDQVSTMASAYGFHFAPDPSSQSIASIGGNIAENSGGPHCLRYGVTLQHVRQMQWVDAQGALSYSCRGLPAERGFDLKSLLCGSEGTLGVVTAARLKLVANAPAVTTLLVFFPLLHDATCSVVSLLEAGLQPVAVEMVDQAMLLAVEEAFGFGFPTDVEGAMIAEFTGTAEEVAEDVERATTILNDGGASEVRQATDDDERMELWKCRKKAFGAVGRLAPRYVTMDVVVPLGRLPELVARIQDIKIKLGVGVSTAFHAGDGNLHPGVHYDDRVEGQSENAHRAADEIIRTALGMGGSATGEHGVGMEKIHVMPWQWDAVTASLQRGIKEAFDPQDLMNPGKILPPADAKYADCKPLPQSPVFRWDSMTVTAPADTPLAQLQSVALERGLCLPVGVFRTSKTGELGLGAATNVGDLFSQLVPGPAVLAMGTARDFLLELWAQTGDGQLFHTGAPVFKNVAGYGLGQSLCGSGEYFVKPLAATFQLKPVCESILALRFSHQGERGVLESLLPMLPVDDITSPVVIFDNQGLWILVGGRNRSWGLDSLANSLIEHLAGCTLESRQLLAPSDMGDFLASDFFPTWAVASENWTMVCKPAGHKSSHEIPSAGPLVWQATPGLWWVPGSVELRDGWYADKLLDGGLITPTPAPSPASATGMLSRLKKLFDPQQEFPPWKGVGLED